MVKMLRGEFKGSFLGFVRYVQRRKTLGIATRTTVGRNVGIVSGDEDMDGPWLHL